MLVNCQSICSLDKRQELVRIMTTASISLIFLTETWLSESISDSKILLGSNFNVVARSDRSKWEHGGVLIAASNSIQTQIIDVKLPQYPFSVACGLLDSIPSFFILIYKPPVGSPFHFNIELLTDCLNEYLAKIKCLVSNYSPTTTVNIYVLGDFNLPGINWETLTSIYLTNLICRSSFNAQAFNFYLSDLFKFLSFNDIKTLDYPEHWYFYLHESFSQSVKMKRAKRRNVPIFFSSHTMHLLNQKETNLRKLTKNWTLLLSLKQRELDKSLNESIELDKQIFIEKINLSCSSHCFRLLRTLGFSKSLPSVMSYSGVSLSSSSEIANGFNTFFGSVFSPKIKYDVPASYEFLPELCIDNVTVSETEIRTLLLRCDDSSSMGADNIPSFVLRECATILSPAVQQLFYWVTKNCTWPSLWKVSYITPLHKAGPLNLVENYRPISILCKLSLVFERILFDFIYPKVKFLNCKQQHGFMKLRSTVTQMIDYLDIVYKSQDISSPALSVYFDIRKAFDTVPHHLLLSKLQVLGFCPGFLLLFESYLSDRLQ